jgi:iron complex transport system substrate-binding protein
MPRYAWLAALLAGLVLFGCQGSKTVERPRREKMYRKVISLSPSTTELIGVYGESAALVGRTEADNYPTYGVPNIEVVASVKPNYERIAAIQPDLLVYDAALFNPQDLEKLKSMTKADTFAITADTVEAFIEQLYEMGTLLGSESKVNEYVMKIRSEMDSAKSEAATPAAKVAVLLSGGGRDYIAGTKSFIASVIAASGGELVGPEDNKFVAVSPESFVSMNPDLIIVAGTKQDMKGAVAVLNNPKYQSMRAIKDKRIRVINEDVLVRRGARVDQLIAAVHKVLAEGSGK